MERRELQNWKYITHSRADADGWVTDRLEARYRERRSPAGLFTVICCIAIVVFIILAIMYGSSLG